MWDYHGYLLRRIGNSGMLATEDAESGDRPCIDVNFAGGETGRQGYRSCGDKETLCHANCVPNGGVRTPEVLRDYPARS